MKIIISPAKKMNVSNHIFLHKNLPKYISKTKEILDTLKNMSPTQLQNLWKCNDSIAQLNLERLKTMDLQENLSPAIFSYEGIQYQYMAPNILETSHLDYLEKHLRILSGFYGVLRPFDGVVPYRLEMQAPLSLSNSANLYDFWKDALATELQQDNKLIINLASKEYSKSISKFLNSDSLFLTITFGEFIDGKVKEKGTMCKMARGQMVRWLSENNITEALPIKKFNELGYSFVDELSSPSNYVFVK